MIGDFPDRARLARLRRFLTLLAATVAVVVAVAIPVIYLSTAYRYETLRVERSAHGLAETVSGFVYSHPDLWEFSTNRLEKLLRSQAGDEQQLHQLLGPNGDIIAGSQPTSDGGAQTSYLLSIEGNAEVFNGQIVIGTIRVAESLSPVLVATGWIALLGTVLATAVFAVLRMLPLRALDTSVSHLNEAHEQLVVANQEVTILNESLEVRVAERTQELREAQQQLVRQERMAVLGQLTATVSHELRNPLGAIRTAIFLIAKQTRDKGLGVERALDRAERGILRCDNIITELLDFARSKDLVAEETLINEWLNEVIEEQPVPDGVTVRMEIGAPDVEVGCDRERVRRAVVNVFENACQALVDSQDAESGKRDTILTVETKAIENRFEISFIDTGPGMDPETKMMIFEPLFSTKTFGVGLGLPIVRQIMEQHGGGCEVESEPGHGTRVVLWLPLAYQSEKAA